MLRQPVIVVKEEGQMDMCLPEEVLLNIRNPAVDHPLAWRLLVLNTVFSQKGNNRGLWCAAGQVLREFMLEAVCNA